MVGSNDFGADSPIPLSPNVFRCVRQTEASASILSSLIVHSLQIRMFIDCVICLFIGDAGGCAHGMRQPVPVLLHRLRSSSSLLRWRSCS